MSTALQDTARRLQELGYRQVAKPGEDFFAIVEPTFDIPASGQVHPDTMVLGVLIEGVPVAYPLDRLAEHMVINDMTPSGIPMATVFCPQDTSSEIYGRHVAEDLILTLEASGGLLGPHQILYDRETMTFWDTGTDMAIAGPLVGMKLVRLEDTDLVGFKVYTSWGEMLRHYPGTQLWTGGAALPPPGYERTTFRPPPPQANRPDWAEILAAGASAGVPALIPGAGFAKEFIKTVRNPEVPAREKILRGATEAVQAMILPEMDEIVDPEFVADSLITEIERMNRKDVEEAYLEAITRDGVHGEPYDATLFGRYLVWETVGAGPAWSSSHPPHFLEVPHDLPGMSRRRRKAGTRSNPDGIQERAQEMREHIRQFLRDRFRRYLAAGSEVQVAVSRAYADSLLRFGDVQVRKASRGKKKRRNRSRVNLEAMFGKLPRQYRLVFESGETSMPFPREGEARRHALTWLDWHPGQRRVEIQSLGWQGYRPHKVVTRGRGFRLDTVQNRRT